MAESFFLESELNVTDLPLFRRRPSAQFLAYLKQKDAPPRLISEVETAVLGLQLPSQAGPLVSTPPTPAPPPRPPHNYSPRVLNLSPVKVGQDMDVFCQRSSASRPSPQSSIPPPTAPLYSLHQIQERIKQEGWVLRRVAELSRDGLWADKRLPKVAERTRPVTGWDQVLEEMRWMAVDFRQERLWKRSAARLQAAAVQNVVSHRQAREEEAAERLQSGLHHRQLAAQLAAQVRGFWKTVSELYEYEVKRRRDSIAHQLVSHQLDHLTEESSRTTSHHHLLPPLPPVLSQSQPEEGGPPCENGGLSSGEEEEEEMGEDEEEEEEYSTLAEQMEYEAANVVSESELRDLEVDMQTELDTLLHTRYPGVCREYEHRHNEQTELEYYGEISDYLDSDEEELVIGDNSCIKKEKAATYDSCVDLDSLRQLLDVGGARERTRTSGGGGAVVKSNGDVGGKPSVVCSATAAAGGRKQDLMDLSEKAESLLPKSVITSVTSGGGGGGGTGTAAGSSGSILSGLRQLLHASLLEFQVVALDWLAALHGQRLPAILADEHGLGRRVVVVAFIAHLVFQVCRTGLLPPPHLLICPLSATSRWEAVLRSWAPALRVAVYGGSASDRTRMRRDISAAAAAASYSADGFDGPHLVLVSYAAFFRDSAWFLGRRWGEAVLAEVQNVVAAGTPAQVAALCRLRADNRLLVMSGPHKENPIDLWTCLRLLFPVTHEIHAELSAVVEGTVEYLERVRWLQRLLGGFTLARSRSRHPLLERQLPPLAEVPIYLSLTRRQRQLYDDYLVEPANKESLQKGEVGTVCSVVQRLRRICNSGSLESATTTFSTTSSSSSGRQVVPAWARLHPRPARLVEKLLEPRPLDTVSLENINLVFLKQELTTTVLTSARLRSIKASRALITELAASTSPGDAASSTLAGGGRPCHRSPPRVPSRKIRFQIEAISRTAAGWNIPGGWSEGMGLVRTASGQVFKICSAAQVAEDAGIDRRAAGPNLAAAVESEAGGQALEEEQPPPSWVEDSLTATAEVNHWRCSGFPLYGQDLIKSLELTSCVRPARSRFRGQGYINCLNAAVPAALRAEGDDWRYTVSQLRPLVEVGEARTSSLVQLCRSPRLTDQRPDPRTDSAKLQGLDKILLERRRERFILITSMPEMVPLLQQYCSIHSFRYVVVSSETDHVTRVRGLGRFETEPRYTLLILAGLDSLAGLQLPPVRSVVYLDSRPGERDLVTRTCRPLPQTVYRLLCRGTVEDAVSRKVVQRRILADLEQQQVRQQTLQDLFYPQLNDNGYLWSTDRKKKEKLKEEMDEGELRQLCCLLGGGGGGGQPRPHCLLDLAELDTADLLHHDPPHEDSDLMAFMEDVSPIQRFGIKQLRNCYELSDLRGWQQLTECSGGSESSSGSLEKRKLDWETTHAQQEEKRQRLDKSNRDLVTYPSQLAGRIWSAPAAATTGQQEQLPVWRPMASLLEEIHLDMAAALLYRAEMMEEEELPPVHVKKDRKGGREQLSLGGPTAAAMSLSSASPPTAALTTTSAAAGGCFHPLSPVAELGKSKIRRLDEGVVAGGLLAPKSLFDRPRPMKALVRPRQGGVLGSITAAATSLGVPGAVVPGSGLTATGGAAQLANQTSTSGLLLPGGGLKAGLLGVGSLREGAGGSGGVAAAASDTAGPDWLIQEDWALHQAVLVLQEMPLSLTGASPAQITNWDLVADMVNSVSKCFRSPRQCRHRYEATILPREEGRLMFSDMVTPAPPVATPPVKGLKKQKQLQQQLKQLGALKPEKTLARPVKTSVLFRQDNNSAWSAQFSSRFETIKAIANKRTPTTKPLLVNPTVRNPKHAAVLSESGISYDSPLSPVQVATNRADRIQKEKQRNAAAAAAANAAVATQHQQTAQQQQQPVIQVQQQQQPAILQQQQVVGQPTRVTVASIAASPLTLTSGMNTINQATPAQAVVVGISQPVVQQQQQLQHQQQQQLAQVVAASVGQARSTVVTQAMVTVSGVLSGLTAGTTATVTRLAGGQIVVSQAGKPGMTLATSQTTTLPVTTRQLTPAQLQALKQQALLKRSQQEQQQLRQKLTLQQQSQQQQPAQQQQQQHILGNVVAASTPVGGGVARAVVAGTTGNVATLGVGRGSVSGGGGGGTLVAVSAGNQLVRPNFRSMTEAEIKAMLAKQQLKVTGPGLVQMQPGTQLSTAQLQQLGLQVATAAGQPVSSSQAFLKTVTSVVATAGGAKQQQITFPLAGVNLQGGQLKAVAAVGRGAGGQQQTVQQHQQQQQQQQLQQLRQLQLQRKPGGAGVAGLPQKVLHQVGGSKLPAQLIVQGQQGKGLPATVTVQQLQQIVKSVAAGGGQGQVQIGTVSGIGGQQIISHAVIKPGGVVTATGAGGQTVQARVIPVSGVAGRGQQQHHTIQVVAAPAGSCGGRATAAGMPSMTLDALSRTPGGAASALVSALAAGNHVKIAAPGGAATQQILNQVTAALASHTGQPISVAVRTPVSVATSIQQQQMNSQHQQQLQQLQPTARLVTSGQQQQQQQQQQVVNLQLSVTPNNATTGSGPSTAGANNTSQPPE